MASSTVKRKFFRKDGRPFRGRQRAFARWAGVSESSVSEWLRERRPYPAARLERLARQWNPSLVAPDSVSCAEGSPEAA